MSSRKELLTWFNGLSSEAASERLRECCSASGWIREMMSGRPYPSLRSAVLTSDAIVVTMTVSQLEEALAAHPRIGEMPVGRHALERPAEWSRQDQAGVDTSDPGITFALAQANQEYERQFNHIYLVCASGKSGRQLIELLRSRMRNDAETEWEVVRGELQKINANRLTRLLAGSA
jgi:2-oxo-4-hydroxy-4-carboxy-5-ureidoimidazoline decarboxylase